MTNIDQFESLFRSAEREEFEYAPVEIHSVLVVTDLASEAAEALTAAVRAFSSGILGDAVTWQTVAGDALGSAGQLLKLVEEQAPDLICTYRNLQSDAWKWQYSLGTHLDLLTQHTQVPVLLLPHPEAGRSHDHALENADVVMAVTDHLNGDQRLVNYAAWFTEPGGTLWLTHVEDDAVFRRYVETIGRIPALDTETAYEALKQQLLKEPHDYILTCREALEAAGLSLTVQEAIRFGHHLADYRQLVEEHAVDLLVMNTKDDDQLAMHGLAYPLAIELRQIPLLML